MFESKKAIWDASDCALILIDYQAEMFRNVHSTDTALIELNICTLAKTAVAFGIPVVLSTVGVKMGVNKPTIERLRRELPGVPEIDRSSMNAWEDPAFLKAVKATEKTRLVICGLYTEICLAYPVIEALRDDYEVTVVVDAVGGESKLEHDTAVLRMVHAGAVLNTTTAMITEWFRDWKAPLATRGREILVSYLPEKGRLSSSVDSATIRPQTPQNQEPPHPRH